MNECQREERMIIKNNNNNRTELKRSSQKIKKSYSYIDIINPRT